ncbi:hypothetical protein TL16_g08601 [Triparma laevis f. inornata]|uniref:Uncharacterized protein n=1 Tax=Triparma laevis f. inornata TaxID=1714386 RepID=A0A9W7EIU4_9STRA|nr:hypothetical protein TL16_g08601 [Triparma laevis f. inornata]
MYRSRVGYERDPKPYLKEKHISHAHSMHMKKMREIKSRASGSGTLDNRMPDSTGMKHLQMRQKQRAMKAQRNNEIASENRNLLKKIAKIITTIPPELTVRQESNNKSLNAIGRSLELDRISKENQKILRRMLAVKSQHDTSKLREDSAHHEKLLKRLRMVKYTPDDASLRSVSRRGKAEVVKEMDETASKYEDDDSMSMMSMMTTSVSSEVGGGGSAGSSKKVKKKKKKKGAGVPNEINMLSPNTVRRNSAKDELTMFAEAAKLDEENCGDPDYGGEEQDKAAESIVHAGEERKRLVKKASSLDLGSGEYTLVLQSKNIVIFTGGYIGGRELAAICVMKKRDGRLRVTVNSEVGDRVEAFKDLTVNNAQKIFDEPIFKDTDIRELSKDELTVIARLLLDWVHIEKVEGGSGHHEVKFMNPLKVPEARESFVAPSPGSLQDRPSSAEVIVTVSKAFKMLVPVVDAPVGLETGVELSIEMYNSRRQGVVDIIAKTITKNTPLSDLVPEELEVSVALPTLVSIDQEMTNNYLKGMVESLNIRLDNGMKGADKDTPLGVKLHVKGGRPQTVAAGNGSRRNSKNS